MMRHISEDYKHVYYEEDIFSVGLQTYLVGCKFHYKRVLQAILTLYSIYMNLYAYIHVGPLKSYKIDSCSLSYKVSNPLLAFQGY